jgi:asparagine synthase (glutamine-hydrolysing)
VVRGGTMLGDGKWDRLRYLEKPSLDNVYLLVRGLFGPRQIQDLLGVSERTFEDDRRHWTSLDAPAAAGALGALGALDFTHYLQNQLLKDTDVMSMAHSIETRVPYLDHRLVEYVVSLPPSLKLARHRPKPLLLDALGDDLPQKVWDRPKMGFTLPFEPWLRRHGEAFEEACDSTGWLEPSAVRRVWSQFRARQIHWSRPWALVALTACEAARKASS